MLDDDPDCIEYDTYEGVDGWHAVRWLNGVIEYDNVYATRDEAVEDIAADSELSSMRFDAYGRRVS